MIISLGCVAKSETGRRSANEDYLAIDEESGIYVVADGTGGRAGGHAAAKLAADTLREVLSSEAASITDAGQSSTADVVGAAVHAAHERILDAQTKTPELHKMSTTVALVLHRGSQIHYAHVGDSRIYLYRGGELRQLTRDHSLKSYLEDNPGVQPPTDVPPKTLLRALGLAGQPLKADHDHLSLEPNDLLVICTDGLTDSVSPWVLREILAGTEIDPLEDVASCLVRAALSHGSMDNISVVLLRAQEKLTGQEIKTQVYEPDAVLGRSSRVPVLGWLMFTEGKRQGQVIALEKSNTVGANPQCKIVIEEQYVSAKHAEVYLTDHGFWVRDLGSTNGTFVNNIRVSRECLVDGDAVRFGASAMVFKCYQGPV
jgi:protein phosphatase